MSTEEKEILTKYMDLLPHPSLGVEPGWFPIIDRLCAKLQHLDGLEATQIKEKFGTLCFYTNYITPLVTSAVREAEIESAKTCEYCGKPGKLRDKEDRWMKTLCNSCAKKEDYI